jgi:putative FmdB family regulatory protein
MPIYDYQCAACGHVLDALQKLSDEPLTDCPECGAPALKRQISAPQFRLKGGGWYETDFKKDGQRNLADRAEKADKPEATGDGKGGTDGKKDAGDKQAKSDTGGKTAAKPEAKPSGDGGSKASSGKVA